MHVLVKDKFIYIPFSKNGFMTFTNLLLKHNWTWVNLFENDLNLSDYLIWGHLTEPNHRHTRGVDQYLKANTDIDIYDSKIAKFLVSGVFDSHGYTVNMTLGHLSYLPIYWIPLDVYITDWTTPEQIKLNGNALTNNFFKEQGLNIVVTDDDIINKSTPDRKIIQTYINDLKTKYVYNYNSLVKNFLDPDIVLYNKIVKQFRIKYGSKE